VEVNDQLQASAALAARKQPPVPTKQGLGGFQSTSGHVDE